MESLYHRFEQDIKLRGLSDGTCYRYLRQVQRCAEYFDCSVSQLADLSDEDLRHYLLHYLNLNTGPGPRKMALAALRFLFGTTLRQPHRLSELPWPKVPQTLPQILSGSEVISLLEALEEPKYRAVVMTLYGSGLRITEACSLQVGQIDSARMLLHVRRGKGHKDRYVMLSPRLLAALRLYWKQTRPPGSSRPLPVRWRLTG